MGRRILPLLVLPALLLAGCGEDRPMVEVNLIGLSDAIRSVAVRLTSQTGTEQKDAESTLTGSRLRRFQVRLPAWALSDISLTLDALDIDGCAVQGGSVQLPAAPIGITSVDALMMEFPEPGCQIRARRIGSGEGLVRASVIGAPDTEQSCDEVCRSGAFAQGQLVRIEAFPAEGSYLGGFTGACTGTGPCQVRMGRRGLALGVAFSSKRVCSKGGFCWENPLPQGGLLSGLAGSSQGDVWAVGAAGTTLHFDGADWVPIESGTTAGLIDVWADASGAAWAVGERGTILRWQGSTWEPLPNNVSSDAINAVWGTGQGDVWMAGGSGVILRLRGGVLSPVSSDAGAVTLEEIWGSGPEDIWAAGHGGTLVHWDGHSFTRVASPTTDVLTGLWGSGAGDVWAVGGNLDAVSSVALHFDGTTWKEVHRISVGGPLLAVWGSGPKDVWAVGEGSLILRWDGSRFTRIDGDGTYFRLNAVWGGAGDSIWTVGIGGGMLHWNGAYFKAFRGGAQSWLWDVHGSGPENVWAVGGGGAILRRDRGSWVNVSPALGPEYTGVWVGAADNVWVVGPNAVAQWNGQDWLLENGGLYLDVWGFAEGGEVWIVGASGSMLHGKNGTYEEPAPITPEHLFSVWGPAPSSVWAVGDEGTILHFDGTRWAKEDSGTTMDLRRVHGCGTDDVWAVGAGGTVLRRQGGRWRAAADGIPPARYLRGVHCAGPDDVWLVDAMGILHFDGHGWTGDDTPALALIGIWGWQGKGAGMASEYDLWAVGPGGGILRLRRTGAGR